VGHKILFIVETGWRGMREASLASLGGSVSVDIFIKGKVDRGVLDIITRPDKGYRIKALSKWFFRIYICWYLLANKINGSLRGVIVSKKRTQRWIGMLGFSTKLLLETESGYTLR